MRMSKSHRQHEPAVAFSLVEGAGQHDRRQRATLILTSTVVSPLSAISVVVPTGPAPVGVAPRPVPSQYTRLPWAMPSAELGQAEHAVDGAGEGLAGAAGIVGSRRRRTYCRRRRACR
jgi:hypothetical protein